MPHKNDAPGYACAPRGIKAFALVAQQFCGHRPCDVEFDDAEAGGAGVVEKRRLNGLGDEHERGRTCARQVCRVTTVAQAVDPLRGHRKDVGAVRLCLLYTSDAADDQSTV